MKRTAKTFSEIKLTLLLTLMLQIAFLTQTYTSVNASFEEEHQNFNFIAYGDSRSADQADAVSPFHKGIVDAYLGHAPEFVIHTGDMVNSGGLQYQWDLFNDSIAAVWGAGIPFYGVAGNHEKYTDQWDVYDDNLTNYRNYFDFTEVVDEPGENELHYSFDYGGAHFVFLNTEDAFNEAEGETNAFNCSPAQMEWLWADLSKADPDGLIVVSFHRPAWSIRVARPERWQQAETVRDEFHGLFVEHGVDLVLTGHDHHYYRTIRDGIFYVITGGGGAPLAGMDTGAPTWQEGDVAQREYHYCNVEVDTSRVTLTALTPDGRLLDSFTFNRMGSHPPSISLTSPRNATYPKGDLPLTFSSDRPLVWTGYSLDGGGNTTINGESTMEGLSEGPHEVLVYGNDTTGTMGASDPIHFTVSFPELPGSIEATVRDGRGGPLGGVEVASTSTPEGQSDLNGTTGADGTISFMEIRSGNYTLEARKEGYETAHVLVRVAQGEAAEASIALEAMEEPEPEPEPEQQPEPETGIPGFPVESVVSGILAGMALFWLSKRRGWITPKAWTEFRSQGKNRV